MKREKIIKLLDNVRKNSAPGGSLKMALVVELRKLENISLEEAKKEIDITFSIPNGAEVREIDSLLFIR